MELDIRADDAPTQTDIDAVDDGLHRYNLERGPMHAAGPLYAFARDAGGVHGGAIGRYLGRYAELQQFWVDEALRGQGIGSRLLAVFEEAARARGADTMILDTFTFQAPAFYARHGYAPILELPGFPQGNALIKMRKAL
jgi:GNAT superfamily N-acetyltransferase